MSLRGVHALPVVNAELFRKRRVHSLLRESNGGVEWTLTVYSHYTQHQFFPPSAGVAVNHASKADRPFWFL